MATKEAAYPYKTRYGSHEAMVVPEESEKLGDPALCVCKDEYGLYITDKKRLDDGLADVNRHSDPEWRRKRLVEAAGQVVELVVNPAVVG